jgi:hypothetical protein
MKAIALAVAVQSLACALSASAQQSSEKVWDKSPWSVFLYRDADGNFDRCSTVIEYQDGTILSFAIDRNAHLIMKVAGGSLPASGVVKGYIQVDQLEPKAFAGTVISSGGPPRVETDFKYDYALFRNFRKGYILTMSGDVGQRSLSLKGSALALKKTAQCLPRPYGNGNALQARVTTADNKVVMASREAPPSEKQIYGKDGRTRFDCAFDALMAVGSGACEEREQ